MKKLWKSGAALAMSVAFIVSSAACGAPIDNSGESSSSSGGKENSALSTEYVAKALEQFASAKSVKISINAETAVYALSLIHIYTLLAGRIFYLPKTLRSIFSAPI